jgi:nitrogen fixation NifU-like protein
MAVMTSEPRKTAGGEASADPADFYRETVLRHSVDPVGFRQDIGATHHGECYNPLCGDRVTVMFRLSGERIEAAAFDGEACAICLASASLLCAHAPGQTTANFEATRGWLEALLRGPEPDEDPARGHPDLRSLAGVRRYPSRIRCALLPWEAAREALRT